MGFPCGSAGTESDCNMGDLGLIPGLGRSPGEGKGYPLQYSGLENSMDCIVHGITKSQGTIERLSLSLRVFKTFLHPGRDTGTRVFAHLILFLCPLLHEIDSSLCSLNTWIYIIHQAVFNGIHALDFEKKKKRERDL